MFLGILHFGILSEAIMILDVSLMVDILSLQGTLWVDYIYILFAMTYFISSCGLRLMNLNILQ